LKTHYVADSLRRLRPARGKVAQGQASGAAVAENLNEFSARHTRAGAQTWLRKGTSGGILRLQIVVRGSHS
jgi:hypothetical protein